MSFAKVVDTGFQYDRTFMLLKVEEGASEPKKFKNMHVTIFTQMSLFKTAIVPVKEGRDEKEQTLTVTYAGPKDSLPPKTISIPLLPGTDGLTTVDVEMHNSPTKAFDMGAKYSVWFSEQFGFEVILAYIGPMRRPILGTFLPTSGENLVASTGRSVSSFLSSYFPSTVIGKQGGRTSSGITFADCAMFLVVTEESLADASSRLPEGVEMDIKKFRPNIVVSGAERPWSEDFWGEIKVETAEGVDLEIPLTHNCIRCSSINIDYSTGKPGLGEDGKMLKKLMSDRRVDKGAKYSPVFGRYGYVGKGVGTSVTIGDDITVAKKLEQTTTFGMLILLIILQVVGSS